MKHAMNILFHTVLIRVKPDADPAEVTSVLNMYSTIKDDCGGENAGILYFKVQENLDLRKDWHYVEIAFFTDEVARDTFRAHPSHIALTNVLREISDWVVGDMMVSKDELITSLN